MCDTLLIRHLPDNLSVLDKTELLKYFGAKSVSIPDPNCHSAFATFSSKELAIQALHRLHQLKIGNRRLVAEFAKIKGIQKEDITPDTAQSTEAERHIRKFLRCLNSWNSSVDFYQPPPPHSKYKYPHASPEILMNIMYALQQNNSFYTQVVHLMNKMSLDPPFNDVNEEVAGYFINNIIPYFMLENVEPLPLNFHEEASEEESELSSEEDTNRPLIASVPVVKKRKLGNPKRNQFKINPKRKTTKKPIISTEDVFEKVSLAESKKISFNVSRDMPIRVLDAEASTVGEIGKIETAAPASVSKQELLENKISLSDMKILPVFKNYHPGAPSQRLYVKNLAKTVTEADLDRIYKRYVNIEDEEEMICYDMRLMQEGRMKGQAFVTFPTTAVAEKALNETNGFILKDKPMVVQFARTAKK